MDRPDPPPSVPPALDRRAFLGGAIATATVWTAWPAGLPRLGDIRLRPTLPGAAPQALSPLQWQTLEAATWRVLPSGDGSPGAKDVHTIGWIDALMADPAIDDEPKGHVRRGAAQLHAFARERGAEAYAALAPDAQDEGLRAFESSWEGQLVLRALIAWTMESFLGDPVHGVNPDQVGWTWAKRRPPYPRPTEGWAPRGEGPPATPEGER